MYALTPSNKKRGAAFEASSGVKNRQLPWSRSASLATHEDSAAKRCAIPALEPPAWIPVPVPPSQRVWEGSVHHQSCGRVGAWSLLRAPIVPF